MVRPRNNTEPGLCTLRVRQAKTDQTGQMCRMIRVFDGCAGHFVGCHVLTQIIMSIINKDDCAITVSRVPRLLQKKKKIQVTKKNQFSRI